MDEQNIIDFNAYKQRKAAEAGRQVANLKKNVEKRNRVKESDFILMMGTALFFDTLQALLSAIPIIGWVLSSLVSVFAWLTFYVWSSAKGWGVSDSVKQLITKTAIQYALPLFEIVPGANVLPIW